MIERERRRAVDEGRERERVALKVLIRSAWFEGEARELGIVVTAEQVRARTERRGRREAATA